MLGDKPVPVLWKRFVKCFNEKKVEYSQCRQLEFANGFILAENIGVFSFSLLKCCKRHPGVCKSLSLVFSYDCFWNS